MSSSQAKQQTKQQLRRQQQQQDEDDELERALDEPRTVLRTRNVAGRQLSYTRHLLYGREEDDFDASKHELPLRGTAADDADDAVIMHMPDPFDEAGYADMDELPDTIAEYRDFIGSRQFVGNVTGTRTLATPAAAARAAAKEREAAARAHLGQAIGRVQSAQDSLLSPDYVRNIPAALVPTFMREASPVLAVLLPRMFTHKVDALHETLTSLRGALDAAGCTFRGMRAHRLRGHMRTLAPPDQLAAYERFAAGTPAEAHAHYDAGKNETRIVEAVFSCIFSGDDDGSENGDGDDAAAAAAALAGETPLADGQDGAGSAFAPSSSVVQRERARHIELDEVPGAGDAAAAAAPEDEAAYRYLVHVICHNLSKADSKDPLLCFRTFFFTR